MFCGLGEEERTGFRKNKIKKMEKRKKKRKKNIIAAKTGLSGMKEYFKTYNRVKIFFAVFKPFLNKSAY